MRNILVAVVALLLAGPAVASERCDLYSMNGLTGAEVLARYPLPHVSIPYKHTNKHVIWRVDWEHATSVSELGREDPRIIAVGDFSSEEGCEVLWEEVAAGESPTIRLALIHGFRQAEEEDFSSTPGPCRA